MDTPRETLDRAQRAARELAAAVGGLDRSAASAHELRQLAADVARISATLDQLAGRNVAEGAHPHDTAYDPTQFVDAAPDLPSHHRHG